jgi:hypothetical protein
MPSTNSYTQLKDGSWVLKGKPDAYLKENHFVTVRSCPDLALILQDIVTFVQRFVVLSTNQAEIISLWIIHTYSFEHAETTPYLNIYSPEKRSGKTRLLEVLELLVNKPWFTGHITAAVLARKVDAECPTLLLDESDTAFKGDKEYSETLRSLLNTGYRRSGRSSICVGQGVKISYKDLSTFCPKAIAGIGKLPDTVADRSIPVVLKRRTLNESIERFRRRLVEIEAQEIRLRIHEWVNCISWPEDTIPDIPTQLDDRAADCIEPLITISDIAGNSWSQKARESSIALLTGETREDETLGIRLLSDIKSIFSDSDEVSSSDLISSLKQIEEAPWNDVSICILTARKLSTMLKPYGIRSQTIRIGDKTPKGYTRDSFLDAWKRYLAVSSLQSATSATPDSGQSQENQSINPQQVPSNIPFVADISQLQHGFNVADVADKQIIKEKQWETEI